MKEVVVVQPTRVAEGQGSRIAEPGEVIKLSAARAEARIEAGLVKAAGSRKSSDEAASKKTAKKSTKGNGRRTKKAPEPEGPVIDQLPTEKE